MRNQASKKVEKAEPGSFLLGLYLRNLQANLTGIIVIAALNFCTPLAFFKDTRSFIFAQGGWKILLSLIPILLLLVGYVQYRIQRPIQDLARRLMEGHAVPEDTAQRGKRRLLNLPFIMILINLGVYILSLTE